MAKQKKQEGRVKGRRRGREIQNEEREKSIAQMSTSELVEQMASLGLMVSEDIALEMARREDAIFYLRKMLQDAQYWYLDGPGDAWLPIHAIHILALIKTRDALLISNPYCRFKTFWIFRYGNSVTITGCGSARCLVTPLCPFF